ncbi:MFS general substrate transporter [Microthyrium microscopicum]|uniref:MFS general substrate transporter n=1 Tax=Microthyrium microscopicum TaxID=703497 RepID=A0A6A6U4Q8_9PEZI|nr:MFS general substrate transporter [Microthyrium microscopicum]
MTSDQLSSHGPGDTEKQFESGITTPDLVGDEKLKHHDQQKEFEDVQVNDLAASDEEYPTGRRLVPIIVSLVLSVFLVSLDMTIVGTAIPKITDEFHGLDQVAWYGAAYFMTFGGFQSASGKFFKYFPLKASFIGSIGIFELVSGVGAAGIATGAFTMIAFAAKPALRPNMMGIVGAVYGLSSVIGPILGGVFSDKTTWRWCFFVNLPVGGLSAILIFIFFKTPKHAKVVPATPKEKFLQMDPVGLILIMAGIISFILAMQYGGQTHPWKSSVVIGLLVGAVLIWAVFIAWESWQGERAMLIPRLMKQHHMWQPSFFQFFFAAGYFVLLYYLPIYFQSVDNATPIHSGVLNLPLVLGIALGSTVSGIIVSKTGHAAPFMMLGAVMGTVASGLIYTFDIGTGSGKWIGYQALYGIFMGMGFQMAINIAQASSKPEDISSATAMVFFFQTIGGAFAISAAQSGFVNRLLGVLPTSAPGVDPMKVIATGATEIRHAFSAGDVAGIVQAYMAGVKVTFIIMIALCSTTIIAACMAPWKRINAESLSGGVA